jgi:hypothetical protein
MTHQSGTWVDQFFSDATFKLTEQQLNKLEDISRSLITLLTVIRRQGIVREVIGEEEKSVSISTIVEHLFRVKATLNVDGEERTLLCQRKANDEGYVLLLQMAKNKQFAKDGLFLFINVTSIVSS